MRKAMVGLMLVTAIAGLILSSAGCAKGGDQPNLPLNKDEADELPDVLKHVLRQSVIGVAPVSVAGDRVQVLGWGLEAQQWVLKSTSDGGATWSQRALSCPFDQANASAAPVMCTKGADGTYHLVWHEVNREGQKSHDLYYSSGTDGRKWQPAKLLGRIGSVDSLYGVPKPRCMVSGEQIHVLYVREDADLVHRRTVDKGRTWLPETVLAKHAKALDMVCEGNDFTVSWIAAEGHKRVFCSRTSNDAGGTWSPVKRTSLPLAAPPQFVVVSTIFENTDLHAVVKVRDVKILFRGKLIPEKRPDETVTDTLYYLKAAKDEQAVFTVHHEAKHRPGLYYAHRLPEEWAAPLNVKRLFKHEDSLYLVDQRNSDRWNYWQSKDNGKTWAKGAFKAN